MVEVNLHSKTPPTPPLGLPSQGLGGREKGKQKKKLLMPGCNHQQQS